MCKKDVCCGADFTPKSSFKCIDEASEKPPLSLFMDLMFSNICNKIWHYDGLV